MFKIYADAWDPEYGSAALQDYTDEPPATVDSLVETSRWSPIIPQPDGSPEALVFTDGVRRVDLRIQIESGNARSHGLFGTFAVGACIVRQGRARLEEPHLDRALIFGSGLTDHDVKLDAGESTLYYKHLSAAGTDPLAPLMELQNAMRQLEARVARAASESSGSLVIVDGPLGFFDETSSPVIGLIKRQQKQYLAEEQASLLSRLPAGGRTPLFAIHTQGRIDRYSWYLRLSSGRSFDDPAGGVVRMEVRAGVGLQMAVKLADITAWCLPSFASHLGSDPRAPQNLYPVGALEDHLRRRLGNATIIRRALESYLHSVSASIDLEDYSRVPTP